jgi:hypothetical protein
MNKNKLNAADLQELSNRKRAKCYILKTLKKNHDRILHAGRQNVAENSPNKAPRENRGISVYM